MQRLTLIPLCALTLVAADEPKLGISNTTNLSYISTGGNSESKTLGFSNNFLDRWSDSSLAFNLGALNASSTTINRIAFTSGNVYEFKQTTTTAESYFADVRYDKKFGGDWYWYAGAAWVSNVPSGVQNKTTAAGGVGRNWYDTDRTRLRTDLGLGYTWDDPVLLTPGYDQSYATGIFTLKYMQKMGAVTTFNTDVLFTDNLQNSPEWVGLLRLGLSVSMSTHLSLKVGYDYTYSNRPKSVGVDVYDNALVKQPYQVPVVLKTTDTIFTVGLSIKY